MEVHRRRNTNRLGGHDYPSIELDEFVVIPNHVHGIIAVVGMMEPASAMLLGGAIQESPRLEKNDPLSRRRMWHRKT